MIEARVSLTQPNRPLRQFVATTGSGHHLLLDDIVGGTGPKPVELLAAGLAGCTAFDVITYLRFKRHQEVTGYEVRVEADQAEKPPQVFTAVRVHHIVTGNEIDPAAVQAAIDLSTSKYCAAQAMLRHTASFVTTFEVVPEKAVAAAA
jgi:putative redox protein